jgi:hypothetical protein
MEPTYSGPAVAMAHAAIEARDLVQIQILGEALTRHLGLGSFRDMVDAWKANGYRPTIRRDMPFDTNGDAYRALADLYDAAQYFLSTTYAAHRNGANMGTGIVRCYPEGCRCHLENNDDACDICQARAGRWAQRAALDANA